jgi:hypothetical protein
LHGKVENLIFTDLRAFFAMKTGKKSLSIFLILLITSVFAFAPVSAKRPDTAAIDGLTVSIDAIEVLDLDGGGEDNDVLIQGKVGILAAQTGTYEVSLTLTMKYLGTNTENPIEKKTKLDMTLKQTIYVDCEAGVWTEADYTFQVNDKIGWYRGQVEAECEGLIAQSNVVEFDPPGGSVGPVWL